MSLIYVIRHDAQAGPYTEEEIHGQLTRGELAATDLAWRDGMAEWQPLNAVLALPSAPPPHHHAESSAPAQPKPGTTKKKRRVPPAHVLAGLTEFLEVFPDRLTITPKGGLGFKAKKDAPGIREIPIHLLLSIGYKLPGFTSGYLEIALANGGNADGGDLLFRFAKDTANIDAAGRIVAFVEGRIEELRTVPSTMSAASLSDELAKLAALHGQGALTDAEFQAAKGRLLA